MPSHTPTTFASAAAASTNSDANAARNVGGSSDWSRSRPNGSTQTFRRPSQANVNTTSRESSQQSSTWSGQAYLPPHMNQNTAVAGPRQSGSIDTRYSKEQLLEMFKIGAQAKMVNGDVQDVLTEGWQPGAVTTVSNGSWSRRDDPKDSNAGPDVCWEPTGTVNPLGLMSLTDEEKELFSASVNSPLKPPPQASGKESVQTPGLNGRKASLSQSGAATSASASRPGARRRETSDAQVPQTSLASNSPFSRGKDDGSLANPPSLLMRRRTDYKEGSTGPSFGERAKLEMSSENSAPFGSIKRSGPASASIQGPSSPWAQTGPQSAGFGAFGSFAIDSSSAAAPNTPGDKKMGFGSLRGESRFRGLMSRDSAEDIGKQKDKNLSLLDRLGETETERHNTSQWSNRPASRPSKEGDILDDFDHRIGSAALGGDESLDGERNDGNDTDDDRQSNPYSNRGPAKSFGSGFEGADRSQTSSTGPSRFGGLGGLGGLSGIGGATGWSAAPGAVGGQARASAGFAASFPDSIFNSIGDVSSPGGVFGTPPSTGYGGMGRGSKMGSLFPQNMQDQMRNEQSFGDLSQARNAGPSGHGMPRDTNSPARLGQGVLDELFGGTEPNARGGNSGASAFSPPEIVAGSMMQGGQAPGQASIAAPIAGPSASSPPSSSLEAASNQMPTAQQRQMVMPDRMRWIYRDPQGNTQGPWSGLEMHDWYKAGFFSPELLVRKQEDVDYEPLAQLIRRIGNSREPFLVPQIGIPHGPPSGPPGGSAAVGPGPMQSGVAQPPFASNFPSFGTTLTAEQQNALERRKQEEQYLMARQKEHLAQQQVLMRQFQNQGMSSHGVHSQGLHHHSSAHSLQSQPSYGSITSPAGGYQGAPGSVQSQQQQPGMTAMYDRSAAPPSNYTNETASARDSDLSGQFDRLSLARSRPSPYGGQPGGMPQAGMDHQQHVAAMLQDRARLQREQELAGSLGQMGEEESFERLEQYHQLRAQEDYEQHTARDEAPIPSVPEPRHVQPEDSSVDITDQPVQASVKSDPPLSEQPPAQLEPVQPPGPSISPLPAPSAQRSRPQVAEKLNLESSTRADSPPVETPTTATLAPWAKETVEGAKGPSLKEIQEAEARKAAQREEQAAAARRAQAEQERVAAAAQAQAQNVAGLPSGATWAAASSPPSAAAPAWAKKTAVPVPPSGTKKTLSQIQKEEEARKNRAAAAAATASTSTSGAAAVTAGPGGKRYADLAGKGGAATATASSGSAWTTVGAGGKAKAAAGSNPATTPQRTASGNIPSATSTASNKIPAQTRATPVSNTKQNAADELQRWAKAALGKGMNSGINVDEFVRHLLTFPPDAELVADSVYGNSTTLDGRRFAEEFVRRRKLADKGQVSPETTSNFQTAGSSTNGGTGANDSKGGGGWSEVAKKGGEKSGAREEATAFKVVAAKKKGKR